jgi:hypothetical protein
MSSTERKDFVVYAFSDENWDFYYIGKGTPKRPYSHNRNVERPKDLSHIHILENNLDEKTAYEYEKLLISVHGRKDTSPGGKLLNSTNGGGGTSGYSWSNDKLEKISGKNHHRSTEKTWYHQDHGLIIRKTSGELSRMFPEEKLQVSALNRLSCGKAKTYKNWIYIEENKVDKSLSDKELKEVFDLSYYDKVVQSARDNTSKIKIGPSNPQYKSRSWCHIGIGFVKDKSCSEIANSFSQTGASLTGLSKLARGVTKYHKGWIFINDDLIDESKTLEQLSLEFSSSYAISKIEQFKQEQKSANLLSLKRGELNPMYNRKGSLHPSFGRKVSEETKEKISEKARKRFPRKSWYHPKFGKIKNVLICELVEMFPDQKLQQRNLSSVSLGNRKSHKGWICLG